MCSIVKAYAERILYDDAPWIWDYHRVFTEVTQPYVRGYEPHPIWIHDYTSAWLDLGPDDDGVRVVGLRDDRVVDAEEQRTQHDEMQQRLARPARQRTARSRRCVGMDRGSVERCGHGGGSGK